MVSCCLSATGIRFSVILHPPGSWALLTVGLPNYRFGPRRGFRVPHARAATGVGALYTPGTAVLFPADRGSRPALAASQRPVPAPGVLPIDRGPLNEASTRVQAIRPSGLPLACGRRIERAALGLIVLGFAPRRPRADGARQDGDRPSNTDLEPPLNSQPSISNPVVHSMRATSRRTPRFRSRRPGARRSHSSVGGLNAALLRGIRR